MGRGSDGEIKQEMKEWEIWYARFPYEEDSKTESERPVIILDVDKLECLSVKVTGHEVREDDSYDIPIEHWKEAGLKRASVARVAKTMTLTKDKFINKKGELHDDDKEVIMQKFMEFINDSNT